MGLRHDDRSYGSVAKALHWLTVLTLAAQFAVGYLMDADDSGRGRGRGRGGDGDGGGGGGQGRGRGRGGDDAEGLQALGDLGERGDLVVVHVVLGLALLVIATARVVWRRIDGLPPWAEQLGPRERRLAHWTERVLLTVLFAMPASGLLVLLVDDDWLALHVVSHLVFFAALAAHLGLILRHQLLLRDGLLRRMT